MLEDNLVTLRQAKGGVFFQLQFIPIFVEVFFKIDHGQDLPGFPVELVLFFEREQQNPFAADELRMDDMGQVDIEVHVGYRTLSADEKHGIALDKAFHEFHGPGKVRGELRRVFEDIEQEYAPFGGSAADHVDIVAKLHIVVGHVDRSIRIALYIIIYPNLNVADERFEIV